jgi:biotin carboxyl carrier protein
LRWAALEVEAAAMLAGERQARVRLGGEQYEVSEVLREGSSLSFVYAGQRYRCDVLVKPDYVAVADWRAEYRFTRSEPGAADEQRGGGELVSKMPGKVLQLLVEPGSSVQAGQPLLILEAMKMEHQVCAPADGVLTGYPVAEGERVMPGTLLADFIEG